MDQGEPLDVIIVGAGISGIGMAAHLAERLPGKRFTILERRAALGGTWDLFRYPGIRSDSDMYTLGYDFAPWREDDAIAQGERILAYLHRVVEERGLEGRIAYGRTVISADWDSAAALWRLKLRLADGGEAQLAGRFLYMGTGYYDYDEAHDPAIPGLERFAGTVAHPQFWPADLDWTDKRVVVIGSGATAVTLIPAMADKAAHVTMLQRTPTWYIVNPARDRLANLLRRVIPEAWAYKLIRWRNQRMQEWLFNRSRAKPDAVGGFLKQVAQKALGDSWREADFTPPYGPWEQRMCLVPDGDMFAAIRAGKASVATGTIAAVEADGIRLTSGELIPADIIVTATGLKLATLGKVAVSMDGVPVDFPASFYYRDCMFSNVPNFAALFGYLNAGWTLRVDVVARWLCRLIGQMDAWGAEVATPVLPPNHDLVAYQPFDLFSSGYLQRGKHLIPQSATTAPWRIHMHYREDRRELAEAPIDDGWMRFERRHAAALVEPAALT